MKILYFYQYFSTPKGSWGTRVYEFAKRWVRAGHEVVVVTSVYYKSDIKATKLVETKNYDGIQVKILNIQISNKQPFTKRVWTFLKFAVMSSWFALTIPADVVVASSGPLTVGLPGLVARYLARRKFVFEVRDLWPDVSIQIGALRNPVLIRASKLLEKTCYKASSLIVSLSPGMASHIKARHPSAKVISVPNAADNEFWSIVDSEWKGPDWAENKKIALYSGNIGAVNNSQLLLEAAVELFNRDRHDIVIVLIGDGQERDALMSRAQTLSLDTMKLLELMPKTELRCWLQRSMCALVPLMPDPILDTSSPNKLFDAMAAGIPVVQTTQGWIKDFIAENDCGFTVSATSASQVADALIRLADSPELRQEMGKNAKRIAETMFDRERLSAEMLKALEQTLNQQDAAEEAAS